MMKHKKRVHAGGSPDEVEEHDDVTSSDESMDDDSENEDNLWEPIINMAFGELQPKFEEKVKAAMESKEMTVDRARSDVYREMISTYRKAAINRFLIRQSWFDRIKSDPVYKAIRDTASRLRNEEEYGRLETLQYATKKRQYLFEQLLNDHDPPEIEDADGDEDSD